VLPFQLLIAVLGGWLHHEQADVIAFLREARLAAPGCVSTMASADASPSWATVSVDRCSRRLRSS
jgi:hypothetical protein